MRFHKLEMVGFKSFVDKTTVTFEAGMTAVVGPNGCGKSNISDAIRWVLGEKSAKNMRGDKMEDVIFNGSEQRKPLGMAEVNLTFQDVDGGPLGFSEFRELTITRRLYRNGESEYLINKIQCRQKDIRDLLMDTGVGSRAYSIIEQGKIGQIVASKPEERRFIIEEVAGITKYKSRKGEALTKLKETEDNLARVSDIIHEVKRQIGSLDRQAKKAEKYNKLSTELRGLELKFAWDDYNALMEKSRHAEADHGVIAGEQSAAENAVSAREADLSEARLTHTERERELMELQREIHRLESDVSRLEAKSEVAATQLKGLDEREARMATEREGLAKEEAEIAAQASTLKEEQLALKAELDALRAELQGLESAYQEKVDLARSIESGIEDGRGRLFKIQAETSQGRNRLTRLDERKANLEIRAQRAAEEGRETTARHAEVGVARDGRRMELEEARAGLSGLEAERSTLSENLNVSRATQKHLAEELARGRDEYARKSSRLHSLKELEEGLEGYGEGVKTVVSGGKSGQLSGIRGLVADMLQAEPEHEKAIEAALGERLQQVVVDGHADARSAIDYLKSHGSGRGWFMPSSPRGPVASHGSGAGHEGVVGIAAGLVKVTNGYNAVVAALLGRTLVVRDMDAALRIWESGYEGVLVTLDGEVVEPHGSLSGGGTSTGGGLLSKKREIRELTTEVERLAARNQADEDGLAEHRSETERLELRLKEINDEVNDKRVVVMGIEKDLHAIEAEYDRVSRKLEVLSVESAQREQEEAEVESETVSVKATLDTLDADRLRMEERLGQLQEELKAVRATLEMDREVLTAKKMELSALIQRDESSARDIRRADLHREELARKAARLNAETEEVAQRRVEFTAGKAEAEGAITDLMKQVLAKKEEVPAVQSAYSSAGEAIDGLEEAVKAARREYDAAMRALTDLELRRTELKLKTEHIVESVLHNYHISVTEIDEEIRGMELDREEAEMNLAELRIKLERLGPVNVGAIEEYNELMERFTFLGTQKEDLESSVRRLKEAIGKINKTSEELFMDAFNSINETFKTVFVSLFGGGQAELRLVAPEDGDLLDSGLDIVAQPPGKRLQSLTLFSGGEKALIAGALVFACFLVKPSPFCVLDEVDAPLDESNVQRFGNMLKEFADRTQFIVITHSRPTMELADALYGVTMDEPGVSRLVSVRLKEATELAGV
ncbi:MAG: chromosome segregation protein SMC [Nitrospirae bacterium]|nr:chromosome segregation protein SMC [Nitrospirota bacterium]